MSNVTREVRRLSSGVVARLRRRAGAVRGGGARREQATIAGVTMELLRIDSGPDARTA
jgi:hypothetical protein